MKTLLLGAAALGLLATAPLASAARLSVDLGDGKVRFSERNRQDHRGSRDRDHGATLISKSTRTIRERDGDRVIITRRVYQQPDGDRFVRESRERIDR